MQFTSIIVYVVLPFICAFYFYKEIKEVFIIQKTLKKIINKNKIQTKDDFLKIKNYLQNNISYNPYWKDKKRPLLRHTATQILKTKYGFCGENARVTIKLMLLGGVKARRIYLYRKEWQHVLIEHEFNGNYYMFDGHYDPDALLNDNETTSIPSENISDYPNSYPNNPYLYFCRIKLFNKISFLKPLSKLKLPTWSIYLSESPYLIKGLALILLTICLTYLNSF